jgi:hypothetical protein
MALKVPGTANTVQFARVLYMLGFVFTRQRLYIRAEGVLNNANEILKDKFCFEAIEAKYIYANLLRNIDIRQEEANKLVESAKHDSQKLPAWYPYLVNLAVPEFRLSE